VAKLVSLRGAARHFEVSIASVRRAIESGRLRRSLVDEGGRRRVDLEIAEQEWRDGTSVHQVAQRQRRRRATSAPPGSPEAVPIASFAVLRDESRVLLCEAIGDPPDPDGRIYSLTPAGALELASALVRHALDSTQTFPTPPSEKAS